MGTDLSDLSFESIFYHWNLFSSSHSICQVFASVFVFLTPCLCRGGIISWLNIHSPYKHHNTDSYSLPMFGWTRHNTRKMKLRVKQVRIEYYSYHVWGHLMLSLRPCISWSSFFLSQHIHNYASASDSVYLLIYHSPHLIQGNLFLPILSFLSSSRY